MRTIVKQRVSAVVQSSGENTPELRDAIWGCPMTHTPIATLSLELAWLHRPKRRGILNLRQRKTITVLAITGVVLLAVAGMFVATANLCGLLVERIQHLQRYNEPRAQYSDVWNWQRRR